MYNAADFRNAYEDYVQYNRELWAEVTPMGSIAGVLGFGNKPGNDPGHAKFLDEMKFAIDQVCAAQPDSVQADAIVNVIFGAKETYAQERISPYVFQAVEGMTGDLIPYLSPEKVQQLYEEYKKMPFNMRTPVRKKLLAKLEAARK